MVFGFPHSRLKHFTLTALHGVPLLESFIFQVPRLSDFRHAIPSTILNRFELNSFKYSIGLFCGFNKCSIRTSNYKVLAYNNLLRVGWNKLLRSRRFSSAWGWQIQEDEMHFNEYSIGGN